MNNCNIVENLRGWVCREYELHWVFGPEKVEIIALSLDINLSNTVKPKGQESVRRVAELL